MEPTVWIGIAGLASTVAASAIGFHFGSSDDSTMNSQSILDAMDEVRRARGLLTLAEVCALGARGNVVLDPFSLLVSRGVEIGQGNVFQPGVQLLRLEKALLRIADGNTFHTNTRLEASTGDILIGSHNEIGDGGFSARTTAPGARILIGDHGRYTLNCAVTGQSTLGSGSQIHGPITVDSCALGAGGSHRTPDPDTRGAVLKGTGRARGFTLAQGQVIQGFGLFDMADVKMQSHFHPRSAAS